MASIKPVKFKHLVLDVDGVLTTGQFLYTKNGKLAKIFGPHDNDGLKLLSKFLKISAVTADKRGYPITQKRVAKDMGLPLALVNESNRLGWLKSTFNPAEVIFIGDGLYDAPLMQVCGYSIAPGNAVPLAKKTACYVTQAKSGEGAVLEACLHILKKFFGVKDILKLISKDL